MANIHVDRQNKDAAKPDNSDKFVTVFTDASHCPDTNAWGVAVWIKCKEYPKAHIFTRGGIGLTNSTEAEAEGIKLALEHLIAEEITANRIVVIQCDNIEALKRFEASHMKWKMTLKAEVLKFKHVKGHSGHGTNRSYINRICDERAGKRMRAWRKQAQS